MATGSTCHRRFARWMCLGYRFEAEGNVIAISGDTVPCPGLERLAEGADLLVQVCFLATPEINNEHFRKLAKYTIACGDTVGEVAAKAGVKKLALTITVPTPMMPCWTRCSRMPGKTIRVPS
ncbi:MULTISPECIES: MBL fold metallo-hydrolase [Bradyrhizobium]|uniref:MBL fold metallo-hydrolase n=1 Tax=Bradyrhizobium TaxID=374 RepID=UPI001EDC06B7|nr:hypothetical protein [Bradyrhizobium zhengyangense]MCG2645355.1 hypothetical protein [Bradyrhizobium zhengyangense]